MNTSQVKAVILGHAVGDALGVPAEFKSRDELKTNPVTTMTGYGTYPYPKGAWSDDTSMSLCALSSLANGEYNPKEIMKNFCSWLYSGNFTPTGKMFDVGNACLEAIENYFYGKADAESCGLTYDMSNGNGSLMRINPFVLYLADKDMKIEEKIKLIHSASALTHAHEKSKVGCGIYAFVLWELLKKPCKNSITKGLQTSQEFYKDTKEIKAYSRLFDKDFFLLSENQIKSSGYVVDTLESAVWCLLTTNSYSDCVLKAVNLGSDTDTVASVAGGLAGALYGLSGIPFEWLETLIRKSYIQSLCDNACLAWNIN